MYILDGSAMPTREAAYSEIKRVLELPDFFGRNLDAMHDMLAGFNGEIRFAHVCKMLNALGSYGCKILEVCFDAAAENKNFRFTVGGGNE